MKKPPATESLLQARKAKRREAHRTAWNRYRGLLATLHAGDHVDPDEADEILASVDKTDEDLAGDVEMFGERCVWAEKLAAAGEANAERAALEAEIRGYEGQIRDLKAAIVPKIEKAQERKNQVHTFLLQVETARKRLTETVLDSRLTDEENRIESELRPLKLQRSQLSESFGTSGSLSPEYKKLTQRIDKLEADLDELRERKLEP